MTHTFKMPRWLMLAACAGISVAGVVRAQDGFGPVAAPAAAQAFKVGSLQLFALHDAQYVVHNDSKTFGVDADPAAVAQVLKAGNLADDRITLSVNALLVHTGRRLILLDSGLGAKANGALLTSLTQTGMSADDVTDVVITHSHGDHVGGLVDASGAPAFPKATIRMATAEWEWMKSQDNEKDLVKSISSRVKTFEPGTTIAPGVKAIALDGHTPGHVGYEITSGKARLLDIGDLAHSSVVSLKKPEWTMGFDNDSNVAKTTRKTTFARLAKTHELVFAPHFPYPGLGQIVTDGTAYRWAAKVP